MTDRYYIDRYIYIYMQIDRYLQVVYFYTSLTKKRERQKTGVQHSCMVFCSGVPNCRGFDGQQTLLGSKTKKKLGVGKRKRGIKIKVYISMPIYGEDRQQKPNDSFSFTQQRKEMDLEKKEKEEEKKELLKETTRRNQMSVEERKAGGGTPELSLCSHHKRPQSTLHDSLFSDKKKKKRIAVKIGTPELHQADDIAGESTL